MAQGSEAGRGVGATGVTPTMGVVVAVPGRRQLDLPPRSLVSVVPQIRRWWRASIQVAAYEFPVEPPQFPQRLLQGARSHGPVRSCNRGANVGRRVVAAVGVRQALVAGMEEVRVAVFHRPPRRWPLVVAGILFVLVWGAGSLARFFLNLLWFREVGKTQVFLGVLGAEVGLGLLTGLGAAVIVGGNLWVAERIAVAAGRRPVEEPGADRLRVLLLPHLRALRFGVVAVLGLLVGLHGASQCRSYMLWRNQVRFGDSDPQFGRDIGFYVFSLPLLRAVFGWLLFTLLVTTLLVVAEYWLLGGIQPAARGNRVAPHVHAHLSLLLAASCC
jgi:hypothetical protein